MAYCLANDIKVLLGHTADYSTATIPKLTEIQTEIDNISNEIDFVLKAVGIVTTPTDAATLGRLKVACSFGAAGRIGYSGFGNNSGTDNTQPNFYWNEYQKIITEIKTSPELYGAVTGETTSFIENGFESQNYIDADYKV